MIATTTVIIPVFNGEDFISAALDSVRAQTRPVDAVIVVDDGSTDRTAQIVAGYPEVSLVRQPNAGPSAARNRGVRLAHGDYVAMLDADDLWPVDRQAVMAEILDSDPSVGVVWGTQRLLVEPGATIPEWVPPGDPEAIDPSQLPRPTGAFLARRSVFELVGLYDTNLRHGEDSDWALRGREQGVKWAMIPEVTLIRRLHDANLTLDSSAQRRAMFEVLQRRASRRRSSS